jgi:hypothetical protein
MDWIVELLYNVWWRQASEASKSIIVMRQCILHSCTFLIIHLGLCITYLNADYTQEGWSKFYFVWEKTYSLLLMLCILYPCKMFKPAWLLTGIVFVLRIAWEVPAIANYERATELSLIQFLISLSCIIITLIITIRCQK